MFAWPSDKYFQYSYAELYALIFAFSLSRLLIGMLSLLYLLISDVIRLSPWRLNQDVFNNFKKMFIQ